MSNEELSTAMVSGISEINHRRRLFFKMGMVQYCMMQYCHKIESLSIPLSEIGIWMSLGIRSRIAIKALDWLVENEFIKPVRMGEVPRTTGKHLRTEGGLTVAEQFDAFWKPMVIKGRKISWTGSKPAAENLFKTAISKYGYERLMDQKLWYFRLLFEKPDRPILMAATFLSKNNQRYTEDFKSQCKLHWDATERVDGNSDPDFKLTIDNFDKMYEDV